MDTSPSLAMRQSPIRRAPLLAAEANQQFDVLIVNFGLVQKIPLRVLD